MKKVQKKFEDWAKSVGFDTLALAPSDRLYENRWYYEQSTETAYLGWMACSELCIQAEARMESLEEMLQWYVDEDEIHESDPENQYWVDGKHKAMKLLEDKQ